MNLSIFHSKHKEMNRLQKIYYPLFSLNQTAKYVAARPFLEKNLEIGIPYRDSYLFFDEKVKKGKFIPEREMKKERVDYERRMEELQREIGVVFDKNAEYDREMKKMERLLGGISNNNGYMAEEYFFNSFRKNKTFAHETFDKILRNRCIMNGKWEAEFDLILLNETSAAIIEVKYRAKPDNINVEKLISRIEPFKALFPDCKNHNIYLGVAAMSFHKDLVRQLHKAGIATIHQVENKMIMYDEFIKAF